MGAAGPESRTEFINRLDKVVVFRTLQREHVQEILEIELGLVQQRILTASANQFVFHCTQSVKNFLLEEGTDLRYGARHLKRAIEKNVVFLWKTWFRRRKLNWAISFKSISTPGPHDLYKTGGQHKNAAGWECFGNPAAAHSLAARAVGYRIDFTLR